MKRREFLINSLATTTLLSLGHNASTYAAEKTPGKPREYYELRAYRLKKKSDQDLLDSFLAKAAIPALNRLGASPVGVFVEKEAKEEPTVFVLIPYANLETYASVATRLSNDADYLKNGAEYLQVAKTNPAFQRIDSWLMLAFAGQPQINLPSYCKDKKPRMFELRTYESYSEVKAAKKVDMFNSGEIETMHEVGLAPVFYGQALIGPNLPHLTYMTSAENDEAHKQHWDAFGKHPVWTRLKNDLQYADTVSKITKWFLVPTAYSQI
jgi:hypothetical protein